MVKGTLVVVVLVAVVVGACRSEQDAVVVLNEGVEGVFDQGLVDSVLATEQQAATARRVGDWALRFRAAGGGTGYRFGLAEGGYVSEGRLAPGREFDCISFVYRVTELAQARSAADAWRVALETRFAGAPHDSVVDADGRVDYDRPEHLDFSVDMIRSGHWGRDITGQLAGAAADTLGSSRYPAGSVTTLAAHRLDRDQLQHGDLVWFVLAPANEAAARLRHEYGLMIGHVGVVVRDGDEVALVHAASKALPGWYDQAGVVRVPLTEYLARVERYDAVMVTRFQGTTTAP